MPPHEKPPTSSKMLRKTKQYVRKGKRNAAPSHDPTPEASVVNNEEEDMRPESRTNSRHDPSATALVPARAKPLPKKRANK